MRHRASKARTIAPGGLRVLQVCDDTLSQRSARLWPSLSVQTASTPQGDYSFIAKSYTDADGSRAGFVSIDGDGAVFQFINCTGPEFADAVTVNQSTGVVTVNAMVDPQSPNCFAFYVSGPTLTLRFSGRPDGNERAAESGAGRRQNFGEIVKFNFQSDVFSEVFTGTTGLYIGAFTGRATSVRRSERTRIK
jgi:hypothetical protein